MKHVASVTALAGAIALLSCRPAPAQNVRQELYLPSYGTNQTIAATTTSASVTLTGASLNDSIVRISNAGTVPIFCRLGNGAQTATAADIALLGGTSMHISRPVAAAPITVVACLASSTTATVYVSTGNNGY